MTRPHYALALMTLLFCGCSTPISDPLEVPPDVASRQDASSTDTSALPVDAADAADATSDVVQDVASDTLDMAPPVDMSDGRNSPDVGDSLNKCSKTLLPNIEPLRSAFPYDEDRQADDTLTLHAEVEGSHYSFEGVVDEIVFLGDPEPDAYIVWLTTTRPGLDPPTLSLAFSLGGVPVPAFDVGEAVRWERVQQDLDCVANPEAIHQFQVVHSIHRLATGEVAYMHGTLAAFQDNSVGRLYPMNEVWDGLRWEDDECPVEDIDPLGHFEGGSTIRLVFPPPANVTAKMGATDIELVGFPDTIHVTWPQRPDFANTTNRCGRVRFTMVDAP